MKDLISNSALALSSRKDDLAGWLKEGHPILSAIKYSKQEFVGSHLALPSGERIRRARAYAVIQFTVESFLGGADDVAAAVASACRMLGRLWETAMYLGDDGVCTSRLVGHWPPPPALTRWEGGVDVPLPFGEFQAWKPSVTIEASLIGKVERVDDPEGCVFYSLAGFPHLAHDDGRFTLRADKVDAIELRLRSWGNVAAARMHRLP